MTEPAPDLRDAIASTLWYHTIELAPGVVTPGWFDLRTIIDRLPWPDLEGKRCLDVGTYDGMLAFEMEKRGASDVIAIDIDDHDKWDWPPDVRATGGENLAKLAGPEKGRGFRVAKDALGSKVDRRPISVYDLTPELMGTFDVVTCGSLMLHLRDPMRALEAIRTVCDGWFMSSEQVDLWMSVVHRRRPVHVLNGSGPLCQWFVPNAAGHRREVFAAGFEVVRAIRPYVEPYGVSHPAPARTPGNMFQAALQRALCGGTGVPHAALLARPRI
ncbi:MAG: methyltransferase domain-containing protein [Actinomycetota bacterium]